jgi:hypothetical protein
LIWTATALATRRRATELRRVLPAHRLRRSQRFDAVNEPGGQFQPPGLVEVLCDGLDNDCNAATPDSRAESCDLIDTDCNCGLYNNPMVLEFNSTCMATTM